LCGYNNILRFLEFDHLDPTQKIKDITGMVQNKNYSVDDVIFEISKCRILCRYCHRFHTKYQRENGII